MKMRLSFDGDLGKSLWKTYYAMDTDVDDPPFCFQHANGILARHGFNFTPVELGTLSECFSNKRIDRGVALSMSDSTLVGLGVNTIQC